MNSLNSNWKTLRLIASGPASASYNMALDEALAESARTIKGSPPPLPTLRIYGWRVPSVSLGRFQRAGDIDLNYCSQSNIPVVRRPTGGRAILHGAELTYSFTASTSIKEFGSRVLDSYAVLSKAFMHAFESLGLSALAGVRSKTTGDSSNPLCFASASYGEITVSGRKIIGSAQRRWPEGFLQQGSIALDIDKEGIKKVFRMDALGNDPDESMAGLWELDRKISLERLSEAVVESFREVFSVEVVSSHPDEKEEELAMELEKGKYLSSGWTLIR